MPLWWNGRHDRLKIYCMQVRGGSSPFEGTKKISGCSLVVKRKPSKLVMWVRFPSPAPFINYTLVFLTFRPKP